MKLSGKCALVTGASRGLGLAIARRYAREGASVCLCARNGDALRSALLGILSEGGRACCEQADVTDERQIRELLDICESRFGPLHILVNNAAILGPRLPLSEFPLNDWSKVLTVNLTGAFLVTRACLPKFAPEGGSIINVTSSVGHIGKPNWGAYAVSKSAVEGLTRGLAEELRSRRIRVNAVNPGGIATEMRHAAFPAEDPHGLPSPDDVLEPFVFLASDEASHVTGKTVDAQHFRKDRVV